MENEVNNRLTREMNSFHALTIVNIAGAGIAMSLGIATLVNNLLPMFREQTILFPQALNMAAVLAGSVFALRWLISSAEMLDGFQEVRESMEDDDPTTLIVENMAFYRENRETVRRLMLGSRATGAFFLVYTALQLRFLLAQVGSTSLLTLMSVVGLALCLALGVAGVYIPSSLGRYTQMWDRRLSESEEAERRLGEMLEGGA
jgi:hypothetical protein